MVNTISSSRPGNLRLGGEKKLKNDSFGTVFVTVRDWPRPEKDKQNCT